MDKAEREAIARRVLAASNADQTEVIVSASNSALTRFTHGVSNQNVDAIDVNVSVRAIVDGRTGVAATNRTSDADLEELVRRAIDMAPFAPADPLQPALPQGGSVTAPEGAFDEATSRADAFARAQICDSILTEADETGYWCAGYASTARAGVTVANSSGALASFDGTDAQANVKMIAPDSSGFAEFYSTKIGAVNGRDVGRRAAHKARESGAPQSVEPGEWTVILEPPAFGELLLYLVGHFSAQSFDEGSSFCSDGLDRSYFADSVTIHDDYAHPLAPGMPFDFEAQPKERLALVEAGIVRNIVTDSYYAKKLNRANTGHALPAPNAWGPQALNVVVAPGTKSSEELISETTRGLLISRFWYIRTVDQKKTIVTGMTRDGTFLIEHGRITGGVRNLRFNQSIVEALGAVSFSKEQHRTGQYSYSLVVPTAKLERFTFTSTTEF
ncbi:MAG: TldD/PmbA family protein [Candidatus Eremiobacteraeota bacterium]|nr:TldD/PmbA family protein [Candidatus Eremiobacteraeota bacterium]